jgi:hypothetical protein
MQGHGCYMNGLALTLMIHLRNGHGSISEPNRNIQPKDTTALMMTKNDLEGTGLLFHMLNWFLLDETCS